MNKQALFSSEKQDWCTPDWLYKQLNEIYHFVLDAAATDKTAKCEQYFTPETDGLSKDWGTFGGAVFLNPPYGHEIGKWMKKAHEESQKGVTVVMLLPARTDTSWFHDYIYGRAEIEFLRGRIKFTDDDGNTLYPAPFPSMICVFNK